MIYTRFSVVISVLKLVNTVIKFVLFVSHHCTVYFKFNCDLLEGLLSKEHDMKSTRTMTKLEPNLPTSLPRRDTSFGWGASC